jgi:short-subunit dehydrogenase
VGMTELSGASILIVGATGGLGREIASVLAAKGARLTLTSRHQHLLDSLGTPGVGVVGDVTEPGGLERFVSTAVSSQGRLDGVIYAAGVVAFGSAAEVTDQTLDTLWAVNTKAPMALLRVATPELEKSAQAGGSPFFLSISGVVAESPTAGIAAYSAVKSALYAHWSAAGREMRRIGIRLLDARPGHTETELSTHPVAGQAPPFPAGLAPRAVAERIVQGIEADERDLPSTAFSALG